MVSVQHLFSIRQIMLDLGFFRPRQARQHIDVVAHHRGFGRHGRHQLELLELRFGFLARLCRHPGSLDLLLDLLEIGAILALPQLLLNRFDLLVQIKIALVLLHLSLYTTTDFLVDIQDIDFALQLLEEILQPLFHVCQIQNQLLVVQFQRQMRRNRVGQTTRIINPGNRCQDFRGNLLVQLDVLIELLRHRAAQRLHFARIRHMLASIHGHTGSHKMRLLILHIQQLGTLLPFHQHLHRAVGQFEHLQNG